MRISVNQVHLVCVWKGDRLVGTVAVAPDGVLVTGAASGHAQITVKEAKKLLPSIAVSIDGDNNDYDCRDQICDAVKKVLALMPRTNNGHPQRAYALKGHKGEVKKFQHNPEVKRYKAADGTLSVVGKIDRQKE